VRLKHEHDDHVPMIPLIDASPHKHDSYTRAKKRGTRDGEVDAANSTDKYLFSRRTRYQKDIPKKRNCEGEVDAKANGHALIRHKKRNMKGNAMLDCGQRTCARFAATWTNFFSYLRIVFPVSMILRRASSPPCVVW
jgi:hypothetical protein